MLLEHITEGFDSEDAGFIQLNEDIEKAIRSKYSFVSGKFQIPVDRAEYFIKCVCLAVHIAKTKPAVTDDRQIYDLIRKLNENTGVCIRNAVDNILRQKTFDGVVAQYAAYPDFKFYKANKQYYQGTNFDEFRLYNAHKMFYQGVRELINNNGGVIGSLRESNQHGKVNDVDIVKYVM
jgi:hypothetical protein